MGVQTRDVGGGPVDLVITAGGKQKNEVGVGYSKFGVLDVYLLDKNDVGGSACCV